GWLDGDGALTDEGRARHQGVEDTTDSLAGAPWEHLGPERSAALFDLLLPLARTISERGGVPVPNPVGVPAL
ncbi:MAG: helix-turn-helix domain-containing protein, partial [Acidimicrobiia bacterium]